MSELLDNIFWHAFAGVQRGFSEGNDRVRRYARGFSPIIAFEDPQRPDFASLREFCEPGERFYCDAWSGLAPPGWRIELESTMHKMVWADTPPPPSPDMEFTSLSPVHVEQAMALAELTRPGPFGPRTLELGDYIGCFEGDRLVAMAGERLQAGTLREVSGICTHPDVQGRGMAKGLTAEIVRRQLLRRQTPFLHVMTGNRVAHDFYLRLGFRDYAVSPVRVVSREP